MNGDEWTSMEIEREVGDGRGVLFSRADVNE